MTRPDDFARLFAAALLAGEADRLASLFTASATALTLTGCWAEGRDDSCTAFAGDSAGLLNGARLVAGKGSSEALGPAATLIRQRYVVSGARDEAGAELPRFAATLIAVLRLDAGQWRATSLTLSATA